MSLTLVFAANEPNSSAVIDLKTPVVQDDQLMIEPSKDQLEISKSLRDANVDMISDPKEINYIRTVPTHPRNRLLRKFCNHPYNLKQDEVKFVRQAPVHPRDRLKKAADRLRKKAKDEVKFIKQVPMHPRDRLSRKAKNIKKSFRR